jgi:hypothetical protein
LTDADLSDANLIGANLKHAKMSGANFREANLSGADLTGADITGGILTKAYLSDANLWSAILDKADLRLANLSRARLWSVSLCGADLKGSNLDAADLWSANLTGADLSRASMKRANLSHADLTGASVFAVSAQDVNLRGAAQLDLTLTPQAEPAVTVDNLEVAQFLSLLLTNPSIRAVIDTISCRFVLILGRFSNHRATILATIREQIRKLGLVPLTVECAKSTGCALPGAVEILSRLSRFIIADTTEPYGVPQELASIVPNLSTTPIQPLQAIGAHNHGLFAELRAHTWVLEPVEYEAGEYLAEAIESVVLAVEEKAGELRARTGDGG